MSIKIIQTSSGQPTCIYNQKHYLHSRYKPSQEAQRYIDSLGSIVAQEVFLFIGGGLAYVLVDFLERFTNFCYWFEPNQKMVQFAQQTHPILKQRMNQQLTLVDSLWSEIDMLNFFQKLENENRTLRLVPHRASFVMDTKYENFIERLIKFRERRQINTQTLESLSKLWTSNIIRNWQWLLYGKPVDHLFRRFFKYTAVLCNAGPSLSDDLPQLAKIRDHVIVIATDTSITALRAIGIDADFILTIDPQPINYYYLADYNGSARFIVDPSCNYLSLRKAKQNSFYYTWSAFSLMQRYFSWLNVVPNRIAMGGSVSTMAYDIAIKMGFKRIILIGQDLSFSRGYIHFHGAPVEEVFAYRSSRINSRESQNFKQISALPPVLLPGIRQDYVHSNAKLQLIADWYARRSNAMKSITINATSLGVRLAGIVHIPLKKIKFTKLKIVVSEVLRLLDQENDHSVMQSQSKQSELYKNLQKYLQTLISDLQNLWQLCEQRKKLQANISTDVWQERVYIEKKIYAQKEQLQYLDVLISKKAKLLIDNFQRPTNKDQKNQEIDDFFYELQKALKFLLEHLHRLSRKL